MKISDLARASFLFIFFLTCTIHTSQCCSSDSQTEITNIKHPTVPPPLFVFGDSLFDPGNNNYINTTTLFQANFHPYGDSYFNLPTGRFSDGRLICDFIAQKAKLPLIPPYLLPGLDDYRYGVNFASGGGGALVESHQGFVIDLETQLSYFKKVKIWFTQKFGKIEAQQKLSEAVYLLSIGGNDYLSSPLSNSTQANSRLVSMVMGNLTIVLKEIYKIGGRKFIFTNLVNLGCLPYMRIQNPDRIGSCDKEASSIADKHNKALSQLFIELEKQLSGFKYLIFDTNTHLQQRSKNPSKYGFKDGKAACCGSGKYGGVYSCGGKRGDEKYQVCEDPNEYVFWDSYHVTEKTYKQLANLMWNTGSYNVKQFFTHHNINIAFNPPNLRSSP